MAAWHDYFRIYSDTTIYSASELDTVISDLKTELAASAYTSHTDGSKSTNKAPSVIRDQLKAAVEAKNFRTNGATNDVKNRRAVVDFSDAD